MYFKFENFICSVHLCFCCVCVVACVWVSVACVCVCSFCFGFVSAVCCLCVCACCDMVMRMWVWATLAAMFFLDQPHHVALPPQLHNPLAAAALSATFACTAWSLPWVSLCRLGAFAGWEPLQAGSLCGLGAFAGCHKLLSKLFLKSTMWALSRPGFCASLKQAWSTWVWFSPLGSFTFTTHLAFSSEPFLAKMYPFSLKLPILIQPKLQLATQVFWVAMCTAFAGLGAIAGFFAGAVFELALAGLFKGLLGCPNSHASNGPEEALEEISCKLIWEAVSLSAMLWLLSTASANMIFGREFSSAIAFAGWLGWEGSFSVDSLTHTHSHTLPHSLPHSLTPSLPHSLTPSVPHSLTPSLPHSLTPSLTHSHSLSLTHTPSLWLTHSLSLAGSLTRSLTHSQ